MHEKKRRAALGPVLILALAVLLTAAACGGGDGGDGATTSTTATTAGSAEAGKAIYGGTCVACHGPDYMGIEGLGKALIANEFVKGKTDAEMVAFLQTGRPAADPLNTTGVDMPPRGGNPSLDDADLADVVAFLRTL